MRRPLSILLAALVAQWIPAQESSQRASTFSTTANLVVINVTVTGRDGEPVENLKKDDFLLSEDGKLQKIETCELQSLGDKPLPPFDTAATATKPTRQIAEATASHTQTGSSGEAYHDRRLMVMLFDQSSMQPADQARAVNSALKFLGAQMTSSDLVSIMVFGNELKVLQDFTDDRDLLTSTIRKLRIESSELAAMADTGADAEDQSGLFVADETEFNIFNTDRKLAALEDAARGLARFPEKKALVYFSGGVEKTGIDNQSELRAAINTAVKANVSFYPIDARGLTAMAPGGDATQTGAPGSSLYSGRGQRSLRDSFQNQQETLYSLAAGTGGKALLDSNDLTEGIRQVQKDIHSYYILTYRPYNTAEDGRYRRVEVKLAPRLAVLRAKLDHRQGYFAPVAFARASATDKEAQLRQALDSQNPVTDLPIALEVDYFRLSKSKYFVPVSAKIPGSALSFKSKGSKAATELDFIGEVKDSHGRTTSAVRDTIPLKLEENTAKQVARKQIQYDTGFTLEPGKYTLRFVVRENGEGKIGAFETPFVIPDLASGKAIRISSVVLSNQKDPANQRIAGVKNNSKVASLNPLIDDAGNRIVPNVTRVFRPGQDLFVYLEVYDPVSPPNLAPDVHLASVAASLALLKDDQKVLEAPEVRANRLSTKRNGTLPLRLQARLKDIQPGQYVCQITIIDELGRKFVFARTALVLLPAAPSGT